MKDKFFNEKKYNSQVKKEKIKFYLEKMSIYLKENTLIKEGTKVKINVEKLQQEKSYNQRNIRWRKFIEDNKDTIFTVEYDKNKKDNPKMVCLKEDPTEPKWLFFVGDLIQIIEVEEKANE